MRHIGTIIGLLGLLTSAASGCASTHFISSWRAPDSQPLAVQGQPVAAVVMMDDLSARRTAEETLAREITRRGAKGIPMYTLMPGSAPQDEDQAKAALQAAHVAGVVVVRPTSKRTEPYVTTVDPVYPMYYGGYYGYGWNGAWGGDVVIQTDTIVTVDTRVYSLKQNKLVWAGKSETTNPSSVENLIVGLSDAVADKLSEVGLIQ